MTKILSLILIALVLNMSVNAGTSEHYDFTDKREYSLDLENTPTLPFNIAHHNYLSPDARELFISIHGYLDNCGYMKDTHNFLFSKGYDVICLDLPGHGLSSGAKAEIEDFNQYGDLFKTLSIDFLKQRYDKIHFISHSTGTIAYVEAIRNKLNIDYFDKVIFVTPLGRNRGWKTSMILHTLVGSFIRRIPRRSSNQVRFNEIKETDPNYINFTTTEWVSALRKWDDEIQSVSKISKKKISIIFAEKDSVVDNNYTKRLYQRLFPAADVKTIKGASHHPDLDPKIVSDRFYHAISTVL